MKRLQFKLDGMDGSARATTVTLPRGSFRTPIFMPVGTQATVKAMLPEELETIGAEVILANAYHLHLRPSEQIVASCGGLHRFMGWNRLILTDSGGFQIFSLRSLMKITDEAVTFRSHIDGSEQTMNAESAMAVQAALGSDIAMAFDQCPPSHATKNEVELALERTTLWAQRSIRAPRPEHQVRFGIVQGGLDLNLRRRHLEDIAGLSFEGVALGGLSVGETPEEMYQVLEAIAPLMPSDRPRYLMGVGRPEDLVVAVGYGIDMFDCVWPTRNARNGQLMTRHGRIVISNARYKTVTDPIDPACSCYTCRRFSLAYLRHLYIAKEIIYNRLATLHNLHYLISLMRDARTAIANGTYTQFRRDFFAAREEAAA